MGSHKFKSLAFSENFWTRLPRFLPIPLRGNIGNCTQCRDLDLFAYACSEETMESDAVATSSSVRRSRSKVSGIQGHAL